MFFVHVPAEIYSGPGSIPFHITSQTILDKDFETLCPRLMKEVVLADLEPQVSGYRQR